MKKIIPLHDMPEDMTFNKLEEILNSISEELDSQSERKFVIKRGCKTHGYVITTPDNFNLCDDPKCKNCREWEFALKTFY